MNYFNNLVFHILLEIQDFSDFCLYKLNKTLYNAIYKYRKATINNEWFLNNSIDLRYKFYKSVYSLTQISVQLQDFNFMGIDYNEFRILGKMKSLELNYCFGFKNQNISHLKNIQKLSLHGLDVDGNIRGIKILSNIKTLTLQNFNSLHLYPEQIILNSIDCLILENCNFNFIGTNLHTVTLIDLPNLTDVSMLGTVHTLTLKYLPNLTDVSMLGTVHTLTLIDLPNLTDVSMLGTVHTLNLRYLLNLTDVSMLGTVHTLTIHNCSEISDVSMLGTVHTLTLSDLENLTDVSMLGTVHTLTLLELFKLKDVSMLGTVHTLTIKLCYKIKDVSMLGTVHTLTLLILPNITDVSMLGTVHTLKINLNIIE